MDRKDPSKRQQAPPPSGQSMGRGQTPTTGAGLPPVPGLLPVTQLGGGGAGGMPACNSATATTSFSGSLQSAGSPYALASFKAPNGKLFLQFIKTVGAGAVQPVGSNALINSVIDSVAKGATSNPSASGTKGSAVPVAGPSGTSSSASNNLIPIPLPGQSTSSVAKPIAIATRKRTYPPKLASAPSSTPALLPSLVVASPQQAPAVYLGPVTRATASKGGKKPMTLSPKKSPKQQPKPNNVLFPIGMAYIQLLPSAANAPSITKPPPPSIATPPPPSIAKPPPPVLAVPTMPPDWQTCYDQTSISLSTYCTFPVDATSLEYATIKELLNPVTVISAEKIVNTDLVDRYLIERKEMLKAKTDDLGLLSKLGLNEREQMLRAHSSCNFDKDPLLNTDYSPNEVLLFHCTRTKQNLDKIMCQGLDERLSSTTSGLLGKGIYFADDPQKSMQYAGDTGVILIFAVLLGDCLSVDHLPNQGLLVREPEKNKQQHRGFNDQFFDSITARPTVLHNEYVIYNRYRCVPIYQVKYGPTMAQGVTNEFSTARQQTPTIAWKPIPGAKSPMPNQALDGGWPFFAASLYERMGVLPEPDNDNNADQLEMFSLGDDVDVFDEDVDDTEEKLDALANLGFVEEEKNKGALLKYHNNLEQAVNFLLDNANQPGPQPEPVASTSSSTSIPSIPTASIPVVDLSSDTSDDDSEGATSTKKAKIVTGDFPEKLAAGVLRISTPPTTTASSPAETKEDCSICCNEYGAFRLSPRLWKVLPCSHRLCCTCYVSIRRSGTTMAGVHHESVRCPFCQGIDGEEVGTCPDGQMTVKVIPSACEGHPGTNSIEINYFINAGTHHLNRTAYLPDTPEGYEVLKLLRTAWNRRLCFTIGTSNTTGTQNALVWNIHHKTGLSGGVQSHGYPDPGYLERVKLELKTYGIE